MLQKWREHGAITCAGYIIGFPGDTKESVLRDIEIIKHELPLDILELFHLTPLPGSEDHKVLLQQGAWMDPDLNKYDLYHRVAHHPKMSDAEWEEAYRAAWHSFYSFDHIRTVLRRAAANPQGRPQTTLSTLLWFKLMTLFEDVHPLEGGAFRRKSRRDRRLRPANARAPSCFIRDILARSAVKAWRYWSVYRHARGILKEVLAAPDRWSYADLSITPPEDDEFDRLDLYHADARRRGGIGAQAPRGRVARRAAAASMPVPRVLSL